MSAYLSFAKLREAELNGVHVEMDNDPDVSQEVEISILHPLEQE
jgi:hypothetical protein